MVRISPTRIRILHSKSASQNYLEAGPVREQPHRVLARKALVTATAPRPAGRPRSRPPASELILQPALRIWNVECGIRDRGCHAINWPEALTRIPNSKFLISFVPVSFSPPAYHPRGARAGHSSRTPG